MAATKNFVYPYKQGSKSAIALAQGIQGKVIKLEGSKFIPRAGKVVVNWGSQALPQDYLDSGVKVLNPPNLVVRASNKKTFFSLVKETAEELRPSIPEFTFSKEEVKRWFEEEKTKLAFARLVLNGHSGEGIRKIEATEQLADYEEGTLFVKYIPKKREFRVHVSKKGVFCVQEKLKRRELPNEEVDFQIRNASNGFVFARLDIEVPEVCLQEAVKALAVTGLDFAAMDVIYNERKEAAYVLEANTAPGLEGSTIENYVEEVGKLANE
jgi:glutathione synthase/RimK-type ligase-like ATP-grasp enzyme